MFSSVYVTSEFVNRKHTFIPASFILFLSLKACKFSSTINISSKNEFAGKCLCVCDSLFKHNKYLNGTYNTRACVLVWVWPSTQNIETSKGVFPFHWWTSCTYISLTLSLTWTSLQRSRVPTMWLCKQIYVPTTGEIHVQICAFTKFILAQPHKSPPQPLVTETGEWLWTKGGEEWRGINRPCTMTLNKMSESIHTHLNPSSWVLFQCSIIPSPQKIPLNGEPPNGFWGNETKLPIHLEICLEPH